MNSLSLSLEKVTSNSNLFKRNNQSKILSQEYDIDGLTFESRQVSSLAFLPILGILIFVICTLLKVYKWSRDNARWKARGDVEFGDEADVNYGIISVGDKDFCQIDIRSDGASVYDTVNSFRFLGNGHATQLCESYPYHDTVTSYKSLLMHRADGNQYDSVKSYEVFLQKVAQKKDLAVDVKQVENYLVHSNSAEHCGDLKENSSERAENITIRMFDTLPLKMHLCKVSQFYLFEKEKPKRRRASGDIPTATKKRSKSAIHRVTSPTYSLPSIGCNVSKSGDSEKDTQYSYRMNRKNYGKKRKKIHSISGGEMFKVPGNIVHASVSEYSSCGAMTFQKQRKHFSADSVRHQKKATNDMNKNCDQFVKNEDLNESQKLPTKIKTITKAPINVQMVESSSENPDSSHSSDIDVPSDTLVSGSDNDVKKIILDDHALEGDVFVSFDSGTEFSSSTEINSPERSLSETKIRVAHAKEQFFKNTLNNAFSLMSSDVMVLCPAIAFPGHQNSSTLSDITTDYISISSHENHATSAEKRKNLNLKCLAEPLLELPDAFVMSESKITINKQQASDVKSGTLEFMNSEGRKLENMRSPHKVQRFHITFVSAETSSHNSE